MATAVDGAQSKAVRLERYLSAAVDDGEQYFKSRFIAEDLDLSPQEIGAAFLKVREASGRLRVEKWGNAGGTTWKVTRVDERD